MQPARQRLACLLLLALTALPAWAENSFDDVFLEDVGPFTLRVQERQAPNTSPQGLPLPAVHEAILTPRERGLRLTGAVVEAKDNVASGSGGAVLDAPVDMDRLQGRELRWLVLAQDSRRPFHWDLRLDYSQGNRSQVQTATVASSPVQEAIDVSWASLFGTPAGYQPTALDEALLAADAARERAAYLAQAATLGDGLRREARLRRELAGEQARLQQQQDEIAAARAEAERQRRLAQQREEEAARAQDRRNTLAILGALGGAAAGYKSGMSVDAAGQFGGNLGTRIGRGDSVASAVTSSISQVDVSTLNRRQQELQELAAINARNQAMAADPRYAEGLHLYRESVQRSNAGRQQAGLPPASDPAHNANIAGMTHTDLSLPMPGYQAPVQKTNATAGKCDTSLAGRYETSNDNGDGSRWEWEYVLRNDCTGSYRVQTLNDRFNGNSGYGYHNQRQHEIENGYGVGQITGWTYDKAAGEITFHFANHTPPTRTVTAKPFKGVMHIDGAGRR